MVVYLLTLMLDTVVLNQSLIHGHGHSFDLPSRDGARLSFITVWDKQAHFLVHGDATTLSWVKKAHGERQVASVFHTAMHSSKGVQRKPFVIDIGSNAGYFGLLALALGAEVVFVEPQPACWQQIEAAIIVNQFQHHAWLLPRAISGASGVQLLDVTNSATGSKHCKGRFPIENIERGDANAYGRHNISSTRATYVKSVLLSNAFEMRLSDIIRGERTITLVKVDTEGAELGIVEVNLLPLLRERLIQHLIMECTPAWWQHVDRQLTVNETVWAGARLINNIANAGYDVISLGTFSHISDTSLGNLYELLMKMVDAGKLRKWSVGQQDLHFRLKQPM